MSRPVELRKSGNGRISELATDPRGKVTSNTFDDVGRITEVDYPRVWSGWRVWSAENRKKTKMNRLVEGKLTMRGVDCEAESLNTCCIGLISTNREGRRGNAPPLARGVGRSPGEGLDGLGSTWALTDSSSAITDTYRYTAFGTSDTGGTGSSINPFRYVGQWGYYDDGARGSSSGLLLLGVRYYSPSYGRFWTWDPVSQLNLYGYVDNEATRSVDPLGEQKGPPKAPPACNCTADKKKAKGKNLCVIPGTMLVYWCECPASHHCLDTLCSGFCCGTKGQYQACIACCNLFKGGHKSECAYACSLLNQSP
jgi:RHS repeat-associated protein